jgi:retinol dehydrogenase 14
MVRESGVAPNLTGQTILITGASSGIGLEAAVKLAAMGAELVLVARNRERLDAAVADVRRRAGSDLVSSLLCDFSSQARIRRLAAEYRAAHTRLDVLVNNAGSVSPSRELTEDGIERTFAVNHLGYFLLTRLLLDLLQKSAPARIVNVASIAHRSATLNVEDPGFANGGYSILKAYARSKLANVLFTRELARRLSGTGVTVNALHPGSVATHIWSHAPWYAKPLLPLARLFMLSPAQGADVIVFLASSPDLATTTGGYYERFALVPPSPLAQDDAAARRLWETSSALVHLPAEPRGGSV